MRHAAITIEAVWPIRPTMAPELVPMTVATTKAHTMYAETWPVLMPYTSAPIALKIGEMQ